MLKQIKKHLKKKNYHYYAVSDAPFNDTEVIKLISEVIDARHKIMAVSATYAHLVSTAENQQFKNETVHSEDTVVPPSNVDSEQLMVKGSHSTVKNEQQQSTYNKVNKDKENTYKDIVNINKEDNYNASENDASTYKGVASKTEAPKYDTSEFMNQLIETCHHYYNEFAIGRWIE
ncbi:hypothetical protein [Alkalicoccobacillus gibsonii]|uniref:hypothetical protein n=1 Tax=Alkalicoccobacillus gibsonii TaxID=79881 RepID=UPI0035130E12